ncbi:hypothetical protein DPMN_066503 [Dreissena polymorpha]|uniref:Ubiquitin-like protease family profile domain-containing protein n=1 Tax=Dreissena polymorpha TaxID=45954 RepID=A0A9D3YVK7_DREPO|nr:hypothetical protein DPMN_066503 [Dreissena polymorpha]
MAVLKFPYFIDADNYIREEEIKTCERFVFLARRGSPKSTDNGCIFTSAVFAFGWQCSPCSKYLSEVQILEYDHLVGAVNEGGFHWSLIVVQPKDNKVLYINPMGEQNVSQQQILQQWIKFVHIRRLSSIDMGGPIHWNILCPRHAKQSDSISCGVYVLK